MRGIVFTCCLLAAWSSSALNAAPFLEGTVSDEYGRPIEGAAVRISDCIGTCWGGKTVLSDKDGKYIFPIKSFRNFPHLGVSMPGRYEVSRHESGPKLYEPDSDTPRKADFVLGTPAAALVYLKGDAPQGWTQTLEIRPGKDAKVHRYAESANHVSGWDYWEFESLPRGESLHLVVVREPIPEPSDDPKEDRKRKRKSWRSRVEIVSPPLCLIDPQGYEVKAKVEHDAASDVSYIIFDSITDAVGIDRTAELAIPDSMSGPPVDAATRDQALELLKRVATAATPWNASPSKKITSYEYDAIDASGTVIHVKIDQNTPSGPAWSDISRQRGVAYMPPLRWLFSQPENIVFHKVDIRADQSVLGYRLKSDRGFAAGIGIGPGWNGFFSSHFSQGTIVIDTKNATVLEHRHSNEPLGEESVETFQDYVPVDQGFAPKSLRIQSGNMDFRLSFKVHDDKLWLLDKATHGEQSPPSFRIENVRVTSSD